MSSADWALPVLLCTALFAGCASAPPPQAATATTATATTAAASPPALDAATQQRLADAQGALRQGRTADAERAFTSLAQSSPELAGPHAALGLLHRQAGRIPESVAEFEQAVRYAPRQPVYFNELGLSLRMQGQFAAARAAYDKAIALSPQYGAAVLNLGILNDLYLGDEQRALELYEQYLALVPGGDPMVAKWVADLKRRVPQTVATNHRRKVP